MNVEVVKFLPLTTSDSLTLISELVCDDSLQLVSNSFECKPRELQISKSKSLPLGKILNSDLF